VVRPGLGPLLLATAAWVLLSGCLAAAASGPAGREPGAAEPAAAELPALPPWRVAYTDLSGANVAVWMLHAAALGRAHGLDVLLVQRTEREAYAALAAGEIEAVVGSGAAALVALADGVELAIVAGLVNVSPYRLMVAPGVAEFEGLRGVRLGVGRPHSAQEVATRAALDLLRLAPGEEVSLLQIGSAAERFAALEAGVVHGAAVVPPDTVLLERLGFLTLVDLAARGAESPSTQVSVAARLVQEEPERVQRFVNALLEAIALVKREPALAKRVLRHYLYTDDPAALDATYALFGERLLARAPFPAERALRQTWTKLAEQGIASGPRPLDPVVQRRFVQAAVDSGLLGRLYDGR
jgi:ABC-type nitrate/sulfonate/bicarbonate transport system substrate-binding protein